jgi:hypothetical protein
MPEGTLHRFIVRHSTQPDNRGNVSAQLHSSVFGSQASVITSKAANDYHFKTGQRK